MNATRQLVDAGQSVWLDALRKGLLDGGDLAGYIEQLSVTGVTSNPTILEHAIRGTGDYDAAIRSLLAGGGNSDPEALVYALALEDLGAAADLLRPTFDATGGHDGYVSIEVPPELASDARGTVEAARRLHAQAGRPNVMVKVPGTAPGLVAVEELIAAGIPVNVTLLFSPRHARGAAEAHLRGLERRREQGGSLAVASVASVFVSRWDTAGDKVVPPPLRGRLGLAMASATYAAATALAAQDRWRSLESAGALPQRLLWASTSTKDPALPDDYYVGALAAPGTVDTVPEATLLAFADHGSVRQPLAADAAAQALAEVAAAGVDVDTMAAELQMAGLASFSASWGELLDCVGEKASLLRAA